MRGNLPFSSARPALSVTPISVPEESNKFTCLDQKEVGTIIKNITQVNSMIINILNLFDTTEEQEWKGLDF